MAIKFYLAIGDQYPWDTNPQTEHEVKNQDTAVAIAYAVSLIHKKTVRLSDTEGYNNQGYYYQANFK